MSETRKMICITINRENGKITVKDADSHEKTHYFTSCDSGRNRFFGCYCLAERKNYYIKKLFNQEIKKLEQTVKDAQIKINKYCKIKDKILCSDEDDTGSKS